MFKNTVTTITATQMAKATRKTFFGDQPLKVRSLPPKRFSCNLLCFFSIVWGSPPFTHPPKYETGCFGKPGLSLPAKPLLHNFFVARNPQTKLPLIQSEPCLNFVWNSLNMPLSLKPLLPNYMFSLLQNKDLVLRLLQISTIF